MAECKITSLKEASSPSSTGSNSGQENVQIPDGKVEKGICICTCLFVCLSFS